MNYDPQDWYWQLDDGRIWSSARRAFVSGDDVALAQWIASGSAATRTPTVADIADALTRVGMADRGPPTATLVRSEAARRIRKRLGARDDAHLQVLIANGSREAIRLLRLKAERAWTADESARAAQLDAADAAIEAIRAASNAMEAAPPDDYAADMRWPV